MDEGYDALSDKEKETLRLMVRGHDAKSMARELSLSVHTINDRLRAARRKLGVTSSREAARLVFEHEGEAPENLADKELGSAQAAARPDPFIHSKTAPRRAIWIGGILVMLTIAIAAALALGGHPATERPEGDPATAVETVLVERFEAEALEWLALVDAGDWDASFAEAGRTFRDPNTATTWREASEMARVPLGEVKERTTLTVGLVQTDADGRENLEQAIVRFATSFENRKEAIETVTLEEDNGKWRVVGYLID
ncbi:DUF4019 domain-containing protein [Qipengyuania sp. 1NDW9]|uniref:helix-turn-helix domain-containing protein n=1 Tax=Qipengyuania xiapuensis TaxID=2867236 RepID=UPI001C872634|nr:DUF4019 domain-containing protein [Qipengyuania xiapuensis]MBX7491837.1 DUF4019 domain-containing protein [Qipengyuania xiapuensis]